MASSRELLDALRAARADETVASVLGAAGKGAPSPYANMNQSPQRALMRDQVDAREAAGVRQWLAYHQQHLQTSERRRVDNRLRAQEAFEASQSELAALQAELHRSLPHALNLPHRPQHQPNAAAETSSSSAIPTPKRAGAGTPRGTPPPAPSSHHNSHSHSHRDPQPHTTLIAGPHGDESISGVPIGAVRDVNALLEAVASRDSIIEGLQRRLAADRAFYQSQAARLRQDAVLAEEDAGARITGLRAQLDASLLHNRSVTSSASALEEGAADRSRAEAPALEQKIAELQHMFAEAIAELQRQTRTAVDAQKAAAERRVAEVGAAADTAIAAAREVYRAERGAALAAAKEEVLLRLERRQDAALREAEGAIVRALEGPMRQSVGDSVRAEVQRALDERGAMDAMREFLVTEAAGRVASLRSMDDAMGAAVARHAAELKASFDAHLESAKQQVSHVAASYAGVDAKGIDGVLTATQAEFRALRAAAERSIHEQEREHLAFMARARHITQRMESVERLRDRYASVGAEALAKARAAQSSPPPPPPSD